MYLHIHVCMHLHMHKYQCLSLQLSLEGPYPGYFYSGVYLKNRDQIINGGMISHASTENTRILGGSGGILTPGKSLNPQIIGNTLKLSILPSPGCFVSF